MVFITIKKVGKNAYAYLYKCTRVKGLPKTQYIAYLGNVKNINRSALKNIKTKSEFLKLKRNKRS